MISIFNRAQLPPLFDPARRDSLCQALDQAGIEYTVKTVDRSSPSALNFGSGSGAALCYTRWSRTGITWYM